MGKIRPMRPTRRQKEIIQNHNLKPDNWLVCKEEAGELSLVNKNTKRTRRIKE